LAVTVMVGSSVPDAGGGGVEAGALVEGVS
jgi:hypothetical protein